MDKRELRALAKQRKRVARLRRKGKYAEAEQLQREICNMLPREADEWLELAAIGKEGNRLQTALAARFEAAKLRRAGAREWLELADEAAEWGFDGDAVEARFRAADSCAVSGDFGRAVELLDQVLEQQPGHAHARRIRRLMAARIRDLPADPVSSPARQREDHAAEERSEVRDSLSFVRTKPADGDRDEEAPAVQDDLLIEEVTSPGWTPSGVDLGSQNAPTPAGYVCNVQPWPTVLDSRTLTFLGSTEVLGNEIANMTETIEIGEGSPVYVQGHTGQLLYCLESGTIAFSRERGGQHDLGSITPGYFFGELGALMGLPSTATAMTLEPCLLRVVSRKQIQQQVESGTRVPPLISLLRSWYLETVLHLCPLFLGADPAWPEGEDVKWVTVRPGDLIAEAGKSGSLHIVVTGFARITYPFGGDRSTCLGYLCPGDLCGEIDPSPVTVTAESVVTALSMSRARLDSIAPQARAALDERRGYCRVAIENLASAAQIVGDVVLRPEDLFAGCGEEDTAADLDTATADRTDVDRTDADATDADAIEADAIDADATDADAIDVDRTDADAADPDDPDRVG